jgi:5-methylcytosine-specific restriction protein B
VAPQPVEAVFFFRWEKQVRQATYGRLSTKDGTKPATRFTKNYIQVSGDAGKEMDNRYPGALGLHHQTPQNVPISFEWPTGSESGELRPHSGDPTRVNLFWPGSGRAPLPWKLGPLGAPETTIPGDPSQTTEDTADAAIDAVLQHDLRPWLLAIKVHNDPALHARTYLENPAPYPQLAHTDLGLLPSGLLQAIQSLPSGDQSGVYAPAQAGTPPQVRAGKIVARIQEALKSDPNVLLVGPPGTGKTVALEDLRALTEHASTTLMFDPDKWHDAFVEGKDAGKVVSLVFHPSYTYEDFVAGLVPESDAHGLKLVARPGPLVSLAHWSSRSDRRALLILDEFNRGPTAAIFGDTLALLDESKRDDAPTQEGAHITRPHANSPMKVAAEFADESGSQDVSAELRLPMNVRIVAALNSSDRSVAPLDAALRRRFAILDVEPDLKVLAQHLGISVPTGAFVAAASDPDTWGDDEVREFAVRLLDTLNQRIRFTLGDDFLLGHALLWPLGALAGDELRRALCHAVDERIVATLQMYFVDQDDLLAAVLGAGQPGGGASAVGVAAWHDPPAAVEAVSAPRLVTQRLSDLTWKNAATALLACLEG